jgi:hypothetical protein
MLPCRAKGFQQNEAAQQLYKAKLSFTIDLTTPDGKLFPGINKELWINIQRNIFRFAR